MKRQPHIVVVGSANTDMIVQVQRLPGPGETVLGGRFSTAAGGKGANQAVAAARAGGRVSFVARLGADRLGDEALAGYRRDGLELQHVRRDRRQPSGVALIVVDRKGENSIAVAPGANAELSPADIQRAAPTIRQADLLLMQLETPLKTIEAAADIAVAHGVPVILNPAPACALPARLLRRLTLITPNEHEAEHLTGIQVNRPAAARRAARALQQRGVLGVVLTLGARGAWVFDPQVEERVPGFRVRAVDATAAGDVFNGALAVALAEGQPLREAARFANAAAALSVTRLGAQPSAPRRTEIEKFLKSQVA